MSKNPLERIRMFVQDEGDREGHGTAKEPQRKGESIGALRRDFNR
jgi:hypothetical protein